MKIVGLMLMRSESWVIHASIPAALSWVDHLVVMNHASVDGSRTIAARMANETGRITLMDWEDSQVWDEMDCRESTLQMARSLGATHIAIIDCDEMITFDARERVRDWFEALSPGQCLDLPMVATWKSLDWYSPHTQAAITLGFCDAPGLCWKPRGEEKYQHHNRPPHGAVRHINAPAAQGGVFHLQYAAWRRFVAKHRWYEMTERIRWPQYSVAEINEKYHWWTKPPHGTDLRAVPSGWWGDWKRHRIALGMVSWHEAECERMIQKHGAETFAGLELFEGEL